MRHREEVVRYETMDQRPVLGHELDILSENSRTDVSMPNNF